MLPLLMHTLFSKQATAGGPAPSAFVPPLTAATAMCNDAAVTAIRSALC